MNRIAQAPPITTPDTTQADEALRRSPDGLTYQQALAEANEIGVGSGKCSDAAKMAQFCDANIQILCGAVSPQLVWEGAQKKGLTFLELGRLAGQGWKAVSDLQWEAL